MESTDKTQVFAAPPVLVHVKKGQVLRTDERFIFSFILGRSEQSDVQFSDTVVSSRHAAVVWEEGQWWLRDLGSKNGTYLGDDRLNDRIPLPVGEEVRLAFNGPVVEFEIEGQKKDHAAEGQKTVLMAEPIAETVFEQEERPIGERTRFIINKEVAKVSQKHAQEKKIYLVAIGAITLLFFCVVIVALWQINKRDELDAQAGEVFYAAKSIELNLRSQAKFDELSVQKRNADAAYKAIVTERGSVSEAKLGREVYLIHKVAREFGEFDARMPQAFIDSVKQYISYLKNGQRYRKGIILAKERGYIATIVKRLEEQYLPRQFFYLAFQESGFDTATCGIPIKKLGNICAKGMWQFIPETARKYDLRTGSRFYRHGFDPTDERHNFEKSTRAAALYLRELYETDAQASGLLVMACYNWGEDNILEIVRQMPKNPRERNFWRLMKTHKIPQETRKYVFYIVSAAVIGEDPRFFGFDFDNPLQTSGTTISENLIFNFGKQSGKKES